MRKKIKMLTIRPHLLHPSPHSAGGSLVGTRGHQRFRRHGGVVLHGPVRDMGKASSEDR